MARARLLKPDFFEDEKLTAMPFGARLLFQAYWCLADREGRLEDRPSRIAAFAFPPMGNEKMQAQARRGVTSWRNLLIDAGIVQRYEVDGVAYLWIVHWEKHQKIHPNEPKSSLPAPLVTIGNQAPPKDANVAGSRIEAEKKRSGTTTETGKPVVVHVDDPIDQIAADFAAFGKVTAGTPRAIEEAVEDYGVEWVKLAVRFVAGAGFEGQPPWSYVEEPLKRWKKQGHPDEVQVDERGAMGRNAKATAQTGVAAADALGIYGPPAEFDPDYWTRRGSDAEGAPTLDSAEASARVASQ